MLRGAKQNGRPEVIEAPAIEKEAKIYLAMSMLLSLSVSPSTVPLTVT
jgi:hypothetical protein